MNYQDKNEIKRAQNIIMASNDNRFNYQFIKNQEYIEKFNEGITKKKMGGEVDKVTDRLIKKYENGDKLTPAGTKHLKSLGMI